METTTKKLARRMFTPEFKLEVLSYYYTHDPLSSPLSSDSVRQQILFDRLISLTSKNLSSDFRKTQ